MLSKKILKRLYPVFLLLIIFCLGLVFGLKSWNQNLYVSWTPSNERTLAMAGDHKNLLNVSTENLAKDPSDVLFSQHRVLQEEGLLSFYLGNILIPDSENQKHRFICEAFPLVEFSFSALGFSVSGEKGLMIVQSPCVMEDMNWIGPFQLPQEDILSQSEKNNFQLKEKDTFIRFYNASIELTPSWLLSSVRFFNEEDNQEFLVQLKPNQSPYFELELLK